MYFARVEADFAAAHFLTHYHGKCERLHGHNYRVRAWVRDSALGEGGMLIDFGVIKDALRTVIGAFDHTNLNDEAFFAGDPSAERIARLTFDRMETQLKARGVKAEALYAVDVFETPTNMARYQRDDSFLPPC